MFIFAKNSHRMVKFYLNIILAFVIMMVTLSVSMSYHFCNTSHHFHLANSCNDVEEAEANCSSPTLSNGCAITHAFIHEEAVIYEKNAVNNAAESLNRQHCCKPFFISNALFKEWKPFKFINWKLYALGIVRILDFPLNQFFQQQHTLLIKQFLHFVPPKISHVCSIVVLHNQLLYYS